MKNESKFPSGTIMAEMMLEIHASTEPDQITILYDKKLTPDLDHFELFYKEKQLLFIFKDDTEKNLGGLINDDILPHFRKVKDIAVFQVDPKTQDPLNGQVIPLIIRD